MPIFVKQWIDGDVSVTWAENIEEAARHFETIACVASDAIHQLDAPYLTLTLTLQDDGNLAIEEYEGAVEEIRQTCFPEVIAALRGYHPSILSRPGQPDPAVKRAVWEATKIRKQSKLSRRLRREAKAKR